MKYYASNDYQKFDSLDLPESFIIVDHMEGFDACGKNVILELIDQKAKNSQKKFNIFTEYIFNDQIKNKYENLNLNFSSDLQHKINFSYYDVINKLKATINFKNFLCSFNGSPHVSRQFLTSALHKFNWFDPQYCSKNFITSRDTVDGNIQQFCDKKIEPFYRKFIIDDSLAAEDFYNNSHGFNYVRYDHVNNIKFLEGRLTESFVHVVSETLATSYYPCFTEKFLYSIVTKGLFVAYGQPNWHDHLEKYYGFKRYEKIFDYRFDNIQNPVVRLVELLTMLAKFEKLSVFDWHDLYLIELDTVNYNYDHYFSGRCLDKLKENESNI
jgi:flavodoxin